MSTFSIQIDATQLVYRDFIIFGKTDWISSRTIQTLNLEPAGYNFQVGSGYFADFTFSVTPTGTVDYDPKFDAFLSGRGSTTLTIAGFPVTLDARSLSGAGVLLVIPATNEDWISYKTCRMVPASYYSVQQGSGEVTSFNFKLGLDGTFSYDPSYDISRGGFLAGSGTSTLEFLGYPILVDARAAGGSSLTIIPIWGIASSPTSVQLATLLPAPSFVLYISGAATKAVFSLDDHGNFSFDSSLSPYLELQTFQGLPIIDPDVIGPPDFRQPVAGQAPYDLWQQRRTWVDTSLATLKQDREAHDLTFILKEVLGDPLPDLTTLYQHLAQGVDIDNTLSQIKALHFTVDSFLRIMAIKTKDDAKQPLQETEWDEVYAILTQVKKVGQFTPWRAEELTKGIILGPQDFWIALTEPTLSPWLATTQDRSAWQQALLARSQPPVIDPDLIGPGDMNNPAKGDPAYDLWQARNTWVAMQLSALKASPTTPAGLDTIIINTLGVSGTDLAALEATRATGTNISARLTQLTLSNEAFVTLLRMRDLVASSVPVLDSEWADAYSILVQVQKQRTFAAWRQEEQDQHIVLGPDLFQIQVPPSADSSQAPPLPAWRATQEARNNWQDTLQSRIDQEQTVISGLQDAVSSTEQETLPQLRSALVLASDAPGNDLPSKSRWLTNQLLIDTEASSCQVTTRVAQAIATIQDLLFSIRTGQFNQANFLNPGVKPTVVSWAAGRIDAFVRGSDNALWHQWYDGNWHDWELLGGVLASDPVAVTWFGRLDIFARGPDNALWHIGFDGTWHAWESLGGTLASDPTAVSWAAGRIDVVALGSNNTVWHTWFDGTWHEESLPAPTSLTSRPIVVSWAPLRLDVFAQGADNALWHQWYDGSWHAWESLGGTLISAPTAVSSESGHLDVFALSSSTSILHKWNTWPEESLIAPASTSLTSKPIAVSWETGRLDVFARGADNALWHQMYDGSWHAWESLGGTLASAPAIVSWPAGTDRVDIFARGTDNALWHQMYDGNSHPWESLGGTLASDPAAVLWGFGGSGRIDVVALGPNNTVWHTWLDSTWHEESLPVPLSLASRPMAISWVPGRLDVFAQGADNALWHQWYDGEWRGWESLGGTLASAPTAVSWAADRIDVFALSSLTSGVLHKWTDRNQLGGNWQEETLPVPVPLSITSDLAAISTAAGHLDVFAQGVDNALWHVWFDGTWHAWESLGGTLASAPTAVFFLSGAGRIDVFALGSSTSVLHKWIGSMVWHEETLPVPVPVKSEPAAASAAVGSLDVFVQGADNALWYLRYHTDLPWVSFGGPLASAPVAVSSGAGRVDVFAQDPSNALLHLYKLLGSSWSKETISLPWPLTLDMNNFEEDWKWIGSYATWRAAMSVVLYPENVLLPGLRSRKTPPFNTLIDDLRANPNLTIKQARQEAEMYSKYFRDVCTLTVEASCLAPTGATGQSLFYMFARSSDDTIYWSTYNQSNTSDQSDTPGSGQSFWDTIPGLDTATQIIGAVPYLPNDKQHQILLFAKTIELGTPRLMLKVYDLLTQTWAAGSTTELSLPSQGIPFSAVVEQRAVAVAHATLFGITSVILPPRVIIYMQNSLHTRLLNPEATDWENRDFRIMHTNVSVTDVYALVSDDGLDGVLFFGSSNNIMAGYFNAGDESLDPSSSSARVSSLGEGSFLAALFIRSGNGGIIYPYLRRGDGTVAYGSVLVSELGQGNIPLGQSGPSDLASIAMYGGYDDTSQSQVVRLRACQSMATGAFRGLFATSSDLKQIVQTEQAAIAPNGITGPFEITDQLSEDDLQTRRIAIQNAFKAVLADAASQCVNLAYLEEAYYFVPVQLALQLQGRGEYIAALDWFRTVYDYGVPLALRKIYYGLKLEESMSSLPQCNQDSLLDPLNPHTIAASRTNSYTRYTLMSIIRCLMDFADAEFTRDTSESVPRADILYSTALALLDTREVEQNPPICQQMINALHVQIDDPQWIPVWHNLQQDLASIDDPSVLNATVSHVKDALAANGSWASRLSQARTAIAQAKDSLPASPTLGTVIQEDASELARAQAALLRVPTLSEASQQVGTTVGTGLLQAVSNLTRVPVEKLQQDGITLPALHNQAALLPQNALPAAAKTPPDPALAPSPSLEALINNYATSYFPSPPPSFCVPANQVLAALRTHAELNLYKLRNCRNIAGQERQLEPYQTTGTNSIFALPPTPYRYSTLIDRAKQLVQLAAQAEAAMLAAIEKHDAEAYNLLKARQDVSLTNAQVQLQSLRVQEAADNVQLAQFQQAKTQALEDHYQSLVDNGDSDYEKAALGFQTAAVVHLHTAAALKEAETFGIGGIGDVGNALAATSSLLQLQASYERRNQDWEFQRDLTKRDVSIVAQQVTIAQDNVRIANQEQTIAAIQADHAAAIVDFLANKFTNAELYEWMSAILQRVYSFFLQQATVMAQLAANQLAFERQQVPPPYIQADYWEAPSDSGVSANATNGNAPDRRGLTGSARLLQDIYQLDQYAFLTNTRKLQLTKTISLSQLAPAEFQSFLETGVLTFATPITMFDSEFPGHYLRLIKRVRLSVIALIPPTLGIRATLSTNGTSRVVIPGNGFQSVVVRREPMSVALSSPNNATGLFVDLDPQPDMLLPFEDSGVDTNWELSMPKAANQFDFRTIADVLITIDYTALDSPDYRQQIVQKLNANPFFSADRPFSFRNDLADQWYDLHNLEQIASPVKGQIAVSFNTQRDDFPPNISDLKIQQVVLYFALAEGYSFEVPVTLNFTEQGSMVPVGGPAVSVDGIISTRTGSAASWISILGKSPIGQWDLTIPDTLPGGQKTSEVFKNEEIEDILFAITFSGRAPQWPV